MLQLLLKVLILCAMLPTKAMFTIQNHLYEDLEIKYSFFPRLLPIETTLKAHAKFPMLKSISLSIAIKKAHSEEIEELYYLTDLPRTTEFLHILRNHACQSGFSVIASPDPITEIRKALLKDKQLLRQIIKEKLKEVITEEENETDES